jgi:hypothetical protein
MAEFIPPLGTADPQIFMDNVRRLDQLMQSTELTFPTVLVNSCIPGEVSIKL